MRFVKPFTLKYTCVLTVLCGSIQLLDALKAYTKDRLTKLRGIKMSMEKVQSVLVENKAICNAKQM